jgi:hypothetical protein
MAGLFLTTAALRVYLTSSDSDVSLYISRIPPDEIWISPLSHAILQDEAFSRTDLSNTLRRRLYDGVEQHRLSMKNKPQYPYPQEDALRKWSHLRSVNVVIPRHNHGSIENPEQIVGPDELLVFCTAAAFDKHLVGPPPTDKDTIELLGKFRIVFDAGFMEFASRDR